MITVALPNGLEFYETTFALWKLGATANIVSAQIAGYGVGRNRSTGRSQTCHRCRPIAPRRPQGSRQRSEIRRDSFGRSASGGDPAPNWKAMTSGGSTGRPKIIVDHMPGSRTWSANSRVIKGPDRWNSSHQRCATMLARCVDLRSAGSGCRKRNLRCRRTRSVSEKRREIGAHFGDERPSGGLRFPARSRCAAQRCLREGIVCLDSLKAPRGRRAAAARHVRTSNR